MKPTPTAAQHISTNCLLARLLAIGPTFTAKQAARVIGWQVGDMARMLHQLRRDGLLCIHHPGENIPTPYALTPKGERRANSLLPPAQRRAQPQSLQQRVLMALSTQATTADTTLARQLKVPAPELDRVLDQLVSSQQVRRSVDRGRFMYRRAA